ncbi:MAG: SPOR domain-containing protein [Bacteroidales bacterium]|nr:SPOR domain-containing protein [Bacteroidales bacterium]
MTIEQHISVLLHKTECVIIPGFGGLITNYQPARISKVQHSFYPPTKNVVFNSNLKNNDGLLANYIADVENISYMQAIDQINHFANTMIAQLREGKMVVLENIGNFTQNNEGEIRFEPDKEINFYEESYGLPTIVSPPIKRMGKQKRIERKLLGREDEIHSINRKRIRWAAAITIPVAAMVAWALISDITVKDIKVQSSKLVPDILKTQKDLEKQKQPGQSSPKTFDMGKDISSTDQLDSKPVEKPEPATKPETKANEDPVNTPPAMERQEELPQYHIIAGSFSHKENAEQFADRLFSEGYSVKVIENENKGLFRVSMVATDEKKEALEVLLAIRNNNHPNAWLLKQ